MNDRRQRPTRGASTAVLALLCGSLLATSPGGLAGQGVIGTRFVVDEARVDLGLRPDELADLAGSLERLMAEKGRLHFPYLEWRPSTDAPPGAAELTVRLTGETRNIGDPPRPCSRYELRFLGRSPGEDVALGDVPPAEMYPICQPLPGSPALLRQDLSDTIAARFDNDEGFRDRLQAGLLSRISLSSDLPEIHEPERKVVVPLSADRARADRRESRLRMEFRAPLQIGNAPLDARMFLDTPQMVVGIPNWEGLLWWQPAHLDIASQPVPDAFAHFVQVLRQNNLFDVRMYMEDYAPVTASGECETLDSCLSGSPDPDPGGGR